jgi:hypothetical protein
MPRVLPIHQNYSWNICLNLPNLFFTYISKVGQKNYLTMFDVSFLKVETYFSWFSWNRTQVHTKYKYVRHELIKHLFLFVYAESYNTWHINNSKTKLQRLGSIRKVLSKIFCVANQYVFVKGCTLQLQHKLFSSFFFVQNRLFLILFYRYKIFTIIYW